MILEKEKIYIWTAVFTPRRWLMTLITGLGFFALAFVIGWQIAALEKTNRKTEDIEDSYGEIMNFLRGGRNK